VLAQFQVAVTMEIVMLFPMARDFVRLFAAVMSIFLAGLALQVE
jgi:hypothetical protein